MERDSSEDPIERAQSTNGLQMKGMTMKRNDLTLIGAAALATAALTVATLLPTSIEAGGEGEGLAPKVAQPKLVTEGVEVTVAAADNQSLKADAEPSFVLKFVNPSDLPADLRVQVAMASTTPGGMMSRMGPMPSQLWEGRYTTTLKPNETKTFTLAPHKKLPANSTISVYLEPLNSKAPVAAANSNAGGIGQQMVARALNSTAQSSESNSKGATPAGPAAQAAKVFRPGPGAIMGLSFSTATKSPQTPLVASARH